MKGHKDAIITLVSPYGVNGHYLYSASRDGNVKSKNKNKLIRLGFIK